MYDNDKCHIKDRGSVGKRNKMRQKNLIGGFKHVLVFY